MIVDLHAHIVSLRSGEGGNYLCPPAQMNLSLRMQLKRIPLAAARAGAAPGGTPDEALQALVKGWVAQSRLDRVVFLALDGVYNADGTPDMAATQMIVTNDFVADFCAASPRLLFGASVHPYRRDALDELERAAARGACLVKWLPSAQNIAPDDPRCFPFYERLARLNMPLLSHTGVEHTLARFPESLNDPGRLEPALRRGVTVIAAHCGTRIFLYERSRFQQWARLARQYPNCYGDLSAFALPLHGGPLRAILADPALCAKVLYGSDFPIPPLPLWYLLSLGWRKARVLHGLQNPFDKAFFTLQELGVPQQVFSRAEKLLRLNM